jgi:hypothetical protein
MWPRKNVEFKMSQIKSAFTKNATEIELGDTQNTRKYSTTTFLPQRVSGMVRTHKRTPNATGKQLRQRGAG